MKDLFHRAALCGSEGLIQPGRIEKAGAHGVGAGHVPLLAVIEVLQFGGDEADGFADSDGTFLWISIPPVKPLPPAGNGPNISAHKPEESGFTSPIAPENPPIFARP